MTRYCSGLGGFRPCERRHECANYRHWLDDPRSEFNVCTVTGRPFKHFVPRDIAVNVYVITGVQSGAQASLF